MKKGRKKLLAIKSRSTQSLSIPGGKANDKSRWKRKERGVGLQE